jgi:hypothetical protein
MENLDKTDYLEVDNPIPGQNYVCLSFVSPETVIMDKQLFMFNKYMSQRCAEFENKLEEIVKEASDELRTSIQEKLVTELHESMKYGYEAFKSKFEDFKYKYRDPLDKQFNNQCNFKTNVRGVKVRGVYDTVSEANSKAKELQRQDRSFHIFVGQVGSWLPWDPCADRVDNEEYLEEDLNTMMKKYKENEVARDMFYEDQKRDKIKAAMEERLKAEQQQKENAEAMEEPDPWMKSKFVETAETTEAPTTEDLVVEDSSNSTTDNSNTTTDTNQVKEV